MCTCVWEGGYVCSHTEVRVQLEGITSLFILKVPGNNFRSSWWQAPFTISLQKTPSSFHENLLYAKMQGFMHMLF